MLTFTLKWKLLCMHTCQIVHIGSQETWILSESTWCSRHEKIANVCVAQPFKQTPNDVCFSSVSELLSLTGKAAPCNVQWDYPGTHTLSHVLGWCCFSQISIFRNAEDVIRNIMMQLWEIWMNGFQECFQELYDPWQRCVAAEGNYFRGNVMWMILLLQIFLSSPTYFLTLHVGHNGVCCNCHEC